VVEEPPIEFMSGVIPLAYDLNRHIAYELIVMMSNQRAQEPNCWAKYTEANCDATNIINL